MPRLIAALTPHATPAGETNPNQFRKSLDVVELTDKKQELSHDQCRNAGDCLIALEAEQHATHVLSTNAKEWEIIAPLVGMEFVPVAYPGERTW